MPKQLPPQPTPGFRKRDPMRRIESDAGHHLGGFRAHALANVRHFVGKADLQGEECVGRILDHFRAGERGREQGDDALAGRTGHAGGGFKSLRHQGKVELAHGGEGAFVGRAHHDPVGIERIGDGAAFAQKFGVAGHSELDGVALLGATLHDAIANQRFHQVAAAHRDGGFIHHDAEAGRVHGGPDGARGGFEVRQVGLARSAGAEFPRR